MREDNIKKEIIKVCFSQAKSLLKEFGEFFPFGFGMTKSGQIVQVSIYLEDEQPSSLEVIDALENAFKVSHEDNDFVAVGICADVLVTPPYSESKMDAIEIRVDIRGEGTLNHYIPYEKQNSSDFRFFESYQSEGTFSFYTRRVPPSPPAVSSLPKDDG